MPILKQAIKNAKITQLLAVAIGVASLLTLICILLLWASTSSGYGWLHGRCSDRYRLQANSWKGLISITLYDLEKSRDQEIDEEEISPRWALGQQQWDEGAEAMIMKEREKVGLCVHIFRDDYHTVKIRIPHWSIAFASLVPLLLATAISFRFTLRTVLITFTLLALILGTAVGAAE